MLVRLPSSSPHQISQQLHLTIEDERALVRRWCRNGDRKAHLKLVNAHLGLVVRIALSFRYSGVSMEDLVQQGHIGLLEALKRFDPKRPVRVSTYATWWIRAFMLDYTLKTLGPFRAGKTGAQRLIFFQLRRARDIILQRGEDVTTEKLAQEMGVSVSDVELMLPHITRSHASLDARTSNADPRPLAETLPHEQDSPEDAAIRGIDLPRAREQIRSGLKILDPREQGIIKARFLRERPATLAVLGRRYGISRERVRQLEKRAKDKLRGFLTPSL